MNELIKVRAIVVRSVSYGDNDKMLTVLSPERGVMSVSAKGVKSLKNKNSAAANPLCYSEMILKATGDIYTLSSADVTESFYPLRESVEALSYGIYFAQLAAMCTGEGVSAEEEVRLLLNTLYVLSKYPMRRDVLCAAFELKLCEIVGVAPIVGDCSCGEDGEYFDICEGESVCKECKSQYAVKISSSAKRVMEYILESDVKGALLFDTPKETANEVCRLVESFMRYQFGKLPSSLEYLKKLQ
jgi:DNA repair protein RecO (recombination protein O)